MKSSKCCVYSLRREAHHILRGIGVTTVEVDVIDVGPVVKAADLEQSDDRVAKGSEVEWIISTEEIVTQGGVHEQYSNENYDG